MSHLNDKLAGTHIPSLMVDLRYIVGDLAVRLTVLAPAGPGGLARELAAGTVCGLVTLSYTLGYAAMMFGGELPASDTALNGRTLRLAPRFPGAERINL